MGGGGGADGVSSCTAVPSSDGLPTHRCILAQGPEAQCNQKSPSIASSSRALKSAWQGACRHSI